MPEMPKNWIELIYMLAPAICSAIFTLVIAFMIAVKVDTELLYPLGAGGATLIGQLIASRNRQ